MGLYGLLDLAVWQLILITLAMTHVTIVSVTIYLHRHSAHNSVELHPALAHFFRFWIWFTTSTNTKEWTAIHRKHHATTETEDDPHSPVVRGIRKVLLEGAELYNEAATPETLERFGKNTPEDWIERNVYTPYKYLGIAMLAVLNLMLFGVHGIWIWAVQMIWIPFFAAGIVNGLGHFWGYRNFECADNARNIVPFGFLIGGEELHNNHHSFPHSPKLSRRWYELDIGWFWIRVFQCLGLARPKGIKPIGLRIPGKQEVDQETVQAITNNRMHIMRAYRKEVLEPAFREQKERVAREFRPLYRRARKLISREDSLVRPHERQSLEQVLQENELIRHLHTKAQELQQLWQRRGMKQQEKVQALIEWCREAEASGIRHLEEFAAHLRSYALRPA